VEGAYGDAPQVGFGIGAYCVTATAAGQQHGQPSSMAHGGVTAMPQQYHQQAAWHAVVAAGHQGRVWCRCMAQQGRQQQEYQRGEQPYVVA
jgi:hypothetical protein